MSDFTNTRLDRYEVRERLGVGGMARVYKAWDTTLDRFVAIKILHDHLAEDPTFKERFEREAKFIASLNHPNIVQVYDFSVTERQGYPLFYMVMSYIPGATLRFVLEDLLARHERMPHEQVLQLVMDLTAALGYAHARGMVHRDVKPGNILLDENDRAILTDFGIARLMRGSRLTQDGTSTGTPAYMSPEQAAGEPGDARSDLYSLAVITFELLTGRTPFSDDGGLTVMLKHLNAPIPLVTPLLDQANPQLDVFIQTALAKNPNERYQNANEFAAAFRSAFANRDTVNLPGVAVSRQERAVQQEPPRSPKSRLLIGGLAVTGVVILLGFALLTQNAMRSVSTSQAEANALPIALLEGNPNYLTDFDEADETQYWPSGPLDMSARAFTPDGFYRLNNQRPNTAETSILNTQGVYNNISISMDARLETSSEPTSGYGIVFNYRDVDHYHVFAVDGRGRFSIWVREAGQWRELRGLAENWTFDEAIAPIGNDNRLHVDVIGASIRGYVNNVQVVRVSDDTLQDGKVGIYYATGDGSISLLVDSFRVFPSVPSMTGQ